MSYREAIDKHKLFRQFEKLADFEDVSKAEVQQLKGLVLDVATVVEEPMANIKLTFKQYTKHDLQHLLNIADHIHDFLPRQKKKKTVVQLNAIELTYLWLAILLHDVGMFVSEADEKQVILDSDSYATHCRHHRDRLDAADEAQKTGKTVKADAIRDAVFAEFIRQWHAERVHAFIGRHLKDSGGDSGKDKLRFRETDLSRDIGFLCESHNWSVRQSRDSRKLEQCILHMNANDGVGRTRVNLRYLACCLRLGDILDFDRTRTPLSAFHSIHFTESISVDEWNKHLSIKRVNVTQQRVEYIADCESPADYVAVHHFINWVDRELQDVVRIVRELPQELADRYQLDITPVADRHQVKMADPRFIAGGFKFQLDYDQIMKLLMDKSLYPDESMFLRELLQNALDACRYQRAHASEREKEGKPVSYIPRIQVWDGSGLPRNPANPDEGPRIEFRDNGVGMSLDQVENFFMRVGKSYYRSVGFQAERERLEEMGIQLDACSRFGIGFLSCFLGGDRIVVETFQYDSRPLRITIEGPSKYFVIEQIPEVNLAEFPAFSSPIDPEEDSPPNCSGTKITVYLRDDWRRNSKEHDGDMVFTTLDTYAVNQDFAIRVSRPEKEVREIAQRRWDCQMPSLRFRKDITGRRLETSIWKEFLAPSMFDLSNYHEQLRGRGAIWFLADHDGNPSIQCGKLSVRGNTIRESKFITAIREVIHHDHKDDLISAMEKVRDTKEAPEEILDAFNMDLREGDHFDQDKFESLASGDLNWAIETASSCSSSSAWNSWVSDSTEITKLQHGDLEELARSWKQNGCKSRTYKEVEIESQYQLALFGIESPGGFQSWDAAKGNARRHNWLGDTPLHVTVDTYGTFSPEPAASRLFVPDERGDAVRRAVTMAFLRHAKSLALKHSLSIQWLKWFECFISNSSFGSVLSPSQVREFSEELMSVPALPAPNGLWAVVAGSHSSFGKIVLKKDYYWGGYLDVKQPVGREHIEKAAKYVGVAPDQIDATVESLSDYLGWDITKGFEHIVQ